MRDTVPPRDLCAYRRVVTSRRPPGAQDRPDRFGFPPQPGQQPGACRDHLADPPARRRGTARPFHRPRTT
ncbi:hypothetical protein IU487_04425 [Nocardia puris]|uniref:hypothetical protein n=1 Tax=Nocardia puris TaxID=208602 RepID=UPI001894D04A|nr:hypothetical protein [Nocardia puris]MBF6210293.1 hypothetical protein [Nocardia puris]